MVQLSSYKPWGVSLLLVLPLYCVRCSVVLVLCVCVGTGACLESVPESVPESVCSWGVGASRWRVLHESVCPVRFPARPPGL